MSVTFQQVIDAARPTLNDAAKTRYSDAECLGYLNDGLLEMLVYRPDLFATIGDITLVAGTDQSAPVGATFVIDIFSVKNGAGISRTTVDVLRAFNPSWRLDAAGPTQNWGAYPQDEKFQRGPRFFVYPAALIGSVLTGQFVMSPTPCALGAIQSTNIPVPDQYSLPLQAYVIFRCETKDDEFVVNERAALFGARFSKLLADADASEGSRP